MSFSRSSFDTFSYSFSCFFSERRSFFSDLLSRSKTDAFALASSSSRAMVSLASSANFANYTGLIGPFVGSAYRAGSALGAIVTGAILLSKDMDGSWNPVRS